MQTPSIVAIVNPISGAKASPAAAALRAELLRAEAERRGLQLEIHFTKRAGHARELAAGAAAAGAALLIAWGGDGTINEAGSALLGTDTTLGIVPAGSGNGLAAALDVPRAPHAALAAAFDGATRAIDAGTIGGRPFFNIAGIGFDARIAKLFNERTGARRGGLPYILIGVREGCRYRAGEYTVELDGARSRVRALLIAFANGREYGLGARIAPEARLDDGLLDVTIVEDRSIPVRFWHARHLARGTAHLAPSVTTRRIVRAIVESDRPLEIHVDGEPASAGPRVEIAILPSALKVRQAAVGEGSGDAHR
jgi:YegS/Rv2252/BmrU family lipid kinase